MPYRYLNADLVSTARRLRIHAAIGTADLRELNQESRQLIEESRRLLKRTRDLAQDIALMWRAGLSDCPP